MLHALFHKVYELVGFSIEIETKLDESSLMLDKENNKMNKQTLKVVNCSGSGSRSVTAVISSEVLRLVTFALLKLSFITASTNLVGKFNVVPKLLLLLLLSSGSLHWRHRNWNSVYYWTNILDLLNQEYLFLVN